ncbi:MAG: monovalent cation/H+ antiporter subunit D family protein [Syntrophaceae bacterium]|nr:monovalent cation/H+ antiporter subunit D family protein [Syntrophaceae bacterium]
MTSFVEHLPILIIAISLFSALTILVVGWFNNRSCIFIFWLTLLAQFIMSLFILNHVLAYGPIHYWLGGWKPPWGIELVVDSLNAYILIILLFLSLACAIYSKSNIEHELPGKRVSFYTLFQLLIAGLCGVTLTGDIFNMFVFIEIFSISAYALIAARGKIALKASFTYLILGSIGTCFFLLGIGFLYSITGSLNLHDLSILLPPFYDNKVVKAAFVFFIVGLSIKMALFPFHTWLPDAHAFAPAEISAMLSGIMIEISTYVFIRVSFSVFTLEFLKLLPVFDILCWVAVAAILMGSVMAITQVNLKRMLAYSSVANMGYIMLAVGLSLSAVESPWGGLNPALMHIANHALMKGCLFLAAGAFIYKANLWNITEFRGLAKKMPYTCAAFVIAAISMIGIPPSVGFVSKLYIIMASIEIKNYFFVAVLLISSLLNLAYFWRVIETMYMKHEEGGRSSHGSHGTSEEIPLGMLIPILLLSSLCIVMGIVWLGKVPIPVLDQVNLMFGLGKVP